MMGRYARETGVSVAKSKAEIEDILTRYGATQFASGWQDSTAMIGFVIHHLRVAFTLPLPDKDDFRLTGARGLERTPQKQMEAWEQACRQRWRALALVIKAKLEAVECGITTLEEEFLAHVVMPNGQTIGSWAIPQLERMDTKALPLLPAS